ncbi:MAG: hypothetical protein PVH84_16920 [Candidatus Aminicenantes bacterium]|jgi:hypothetical protein
MQKNASIIQSVVFFFLLVFLVQGFYMPQDIRLDTGDSAGASRSNAPKICFTGPNVYVTWEDERNVIGDVFFNYSSDYGLNWQLSDVQLDTEFGESLFPEICCDLNKVYVAWYDFRGTNWGVYFNCSHDYGQTWQATDIRLDTGGGIATTSFGASEGPRICCNGDKVYIAWPDKRNGEEDIYLNYSHDGGLNWQADDIRIDTGDTEGSYGSIQPQIACGPLQVYVTWEDKRNGHNDIYFNGSSDSGMTWFPAAERIDLGDPAGASISQKPDICCNVSQVYISWIDNRNGSYDVYFNRSLDEGLNWMTSDIRLDTQDSAGANTSSMPQIFISAGIVSVVWQDQCNGDYDIYFNRSSDFGVSWLAAAMRIDSGDSPGSHISLNPRISGQMSELCIVWRDDRNGTGDIFLNYSNSSGYSWLPSAVRIDKGSAHSAYAQLSSMWGKVFVTWHDTRNGEQDIYFTSLPAWSDVGVKNSLVGDIQDGSFLDMGARPLAQVVGTEIPFTIENTGSGPLTLDGSPEMVYLTGSGAKYFMVTEQPSKSILYPGESTVFKIRTKTTATPSVPPGWMKTDSFTVNIPNNSILKTLFDFTIELTVTN